MNIGSVNRIGWANRRGADRRAQPLTAQMSHKKARRRVVRRRAPYGSGRGRCQDAGMWSRLDQPPEGVFDLLAHGRTWGGAVKTKVCKPAHVHGLLAGVIENS